MLNTPCDGVPYPEDTVVLLGRDTAPMKVVEKGFVTSIVQPTPQAATFMLLGTYPDMGLTQGFEHT
jgi:hypothetical protein